MENKIINEINKYKLQLIINKNLCDNNVISSNVHEKMESNLLEKINRLTKETEMIN